MQDEIFPDKDILVEFLETMPLSSMGITPFIHMGSCVVGGAYLPIVMKPLL